MLSDDRDKPLNELARKLTSLRESLQEGADASRLRQDLSIYQEELNTQMEHVLDLQRSLEESRDRYAELYDFAPFAHLTLDGSGMVEEINLTGARMLGADRARIEALPLASFVLKSDRPTFLEHMRRCRKGESPVVSEVRFRRPEGSSLVAELHSQRSEGKDGPHYRTAILDVTGRREMGEELRASERRLAAAVEASGVGVHEHAIPVGEGRGYYSEQWAAILGFRPQELPPPKQFQDWFLSRVHPDDCRRVEKAYRELVRGHVDLYRVEARLRRKDGKWIWVKGLSKAVERDESGRATRVVGVMQDITEEKQRIIDAERRNAQLRALASALFQVEERERRQLASDLHDDLGQILVAAKMKLAVALQAPQSEALGEPLQDLSHLLDRADSSIRAVIFQASPPVLHDLGFVPALERLGRDLRRQYGLGVELLIEKHLPPVDQKMRFMLFRSVRELLINVAKHAGVERARVIVGTEGDRLSVTVADEGTGFEPAELLSPDRIESETKGFGLFSIQERIEPMGGSLSVESAPGKGARATILIPIHLPEPEEQSAPAPPLPPEVSEEGRIEGEDIARSDDKIRVLLADDHKVVRSALASMLSAQPDIEIIAEASDGEMAVELARRYPVDVVVMDVSMPRLNGIEATRRLLHELPHVRVIGLSMHEGDDMAIAMCQAGAATYLTKSGPAYTLISAIRAVHSGVTSH